MSDEQWIAVISSNSIDWLHALPIASCGLRLENEDIRVAVGLCLSAALCQTHRCPCGAPAVPLRCPCGAPAVPLRCPCGAPAVPLRCPCGALVEVNGHHGLSCKLGSGKHSRHASVNNIIFRACCPAGNPTVKEPTGLTRTNGKRPDGSTLVPWSAGKCVRYDC